MIVIPAIDLKGGECVRLRQGRMDDATIFSDDPVAMAGHWLEEGARRLHIVDLDGAFEGVPVNLNVIKSIVEAYPDLPIQVGGGIRNRETIAQYLDAGVKYVIIGTWAVKEPDEVTKICQEYAGHIILGLDAKKEKVAIEGWASVSELTVVELAKHYETAGASAIIYTDISRDGMMKGVNIKNTVALADAVTIPIIASGGVTNLDDIRSLCAVSEHGIEGVIAGRSLYEHTLQLAEAQRLSDSLCG